MVIENANDIEFHEVIGKAGTVGNIVLSRPTALNALNFSMLHALRKQLHSWAFKPEIKAVCIQANGDRAFCAGGDLKEIYYLQKQDPKLAQEFFHTEYRLNYLVKYYPKPYISLLHGIVMGGGVGISHHGSLRLADPSLTWAMPETGIGFYPDVGATYALSRISDNVGLFLGLTGRKIGLADGLYLKIIDAELPKAQFNNFIQSLADTKTINIRAILADLRSRVKTTVESSHLKLEAPAIKATLANAKIAEIMERLQEQDDPWSRRLYSTLQKKSPMSLAITLTALQKAKNYTFTECMNMEYALTKICLSKNDFLEGIRALIIDKDQYPKWEPAKITAINTNMVLEYFPGLTNELDLPMMQENFI